MKDIQLSEHFKLSEFIKSATADKLGIKNEPTDIEIGHLRLLCTYLLEPLREGWSRIYTDAGIKVTSGFRCEKLNNSTKNASKTSAHRLGYAVDIVPSNGKIAEFKKFVKKELNLLITFDGSHKYHFDQCIDEKNGGSEWVHIGLMNAQGEQRRQFLITKDGKNYKEDKV